MLRPEHELRRLPGGVVSNVRPERKLVLESLQIPVGARLSRRNDEARCCPGVRVPQWFCSLISAANKTETAYTGM